jgi:hypothetical protein
VAVLAIKVYEVFLENGVETGRTGRRSDARLAAAVVKVNEEFGAD